MFRDSSKLELVRLTVPLSGYRACRLAIDLYVVEYLTDQGYSVAMAGSVYLVFNLVSIFAGCLNLWVPELAFLSRLSATIFFLGTPAVTVAGLIGMFFSNSTVGVFLFASLSGIGQKTWFSGYQTIVNKCYARKETSTISQLQQASQCVGFLLPSIVLGIFNGLQDDSGIIIRRSIATLGAIAAATHLVGAGIIIRKASTKMERSSRYFIAEESILVTGRRFLGSWAFVLNLLIAMLVCIAASTLGTAGILTEDIFLLESTDLWLIAIGFPIGGFLYSVVNNFVSKRKTDSDGDDTLKNGLGIIVVLITTLVVACVTDGSLMKEEKPLAIILSLCYGTANGFFFNGMFAGAWALWLKELHSYDAVFVSRSHIFHECIFSSVVAALGFQLHTIVIDIALSSESATRSTVSFALIGPIILFMVICFGLFVWIPPEKDSKFDWPIRFSKTSMWVIRFAKMLGLPSEDLLFGRFNVLRNGPIIDQIDIENANWAGPAPTKSSSLTVPDFKEHLQSFKVSEKSSKDAYFLTKHARVDSFVFENKDALLKLQDLIGIAQKSICIFTWSLDDSVSMSLADQLLAKKSQGIYVKIVVDAVNLFYVSEVLDTFHSIMSKGLKVIKKLLEGGIEVRMFDRWKEFEGTRMAPIVAGSHRKILLVDDHWLYTGGRNISDKYLLFSDDDNESSDYFFYDLDVTLSGDFSTTTAVLLDKLWKKARTTKSIFESCNDDDGAAQKQDAPQKPKLATVQAGDESSTSILSETDFNVEETKHSLYMDPKVANDKCGDDDNSVESIIDFTCDVETGRLAALFPAYEETSNGLCAVSDVVVNEVEIDNSDDDDSSSVESIIDFTCDDEEGRAGRLLTDEATVHEVGTMVQSESIENGDVSVFELDHKAGNPDAKDIIFSSVIFLIEKAASTIDFWFGYFTLFPELEEPLKRAISRGVRIRLITNSQETNDVHFLSKVFSDAKEKLVEIGVEVYVPKVERGPNFCCHHKVMIVDERVALIGSWNMMSSSIFFDDEYSVVVFSNNNNTKALAPLQNHFEEEMKEGKLQRMNEIKKCTWKVPAWQRLFVPKSSIRLSEIGY